MKDDKTLRIILNDRIKTFKRDYPKAVQKGIEKIMATKYNVKYGDVVDIFNEISPRTIDELSYDMLYKFMDSVHDFAMSREVNEFDMSGLQANLYFTDYEIKEFKKPYPKEERDFDLIITDWKQVTPYKYKIYITIDELIRWRNFNKLRFNPETQRDMITIIVNGVPIHKLDIKRSSVNSIKKLMYKGLYYNVCGTINTNPEYNELPRIVGKKLIIPMGCHMDLIEGFHNYTAETELKDEHPEWEPNEPIEFDLRILTKDEANQFIWQMNEKNHFKDEQKIRLDKLNPTNYVIEQLNKDTDFYLYGTIDNEMKVFLNEIISKLFSIDDDIPKQLELVKVFENKLNSIIKTTNHYGTKLSKEEWFAYINIISYCIKKEIDINLFLININIQDIISTLSINKKLLTSHYSNINKILEEVKTDVL